MNESKPIPESTPFSVYCQARAVTSQGSNYPTSMCGNDPRLLFAAMLGIEDALRFKREAPVRSPLCYPTEIQILSAVDAAFPRHERVAEALATDPGWSVMLTWDGEDNEPAEERRIIDVIVGGRFRPTRATWQKLIDAGLPMCSYEEASEGWDVSEAHPEQGSPSGAALVPADGRMSDWREPRLNELIGRLRAIEPDGNFGHGATVDEDLTNLVSVARSAVGALSKIADDAGSLLATSADRACQ